ncbi:MAG: hypothetical protein ACRCT2_16490, partial [Plesiomonas shigelloides]
MHPEWDPLTMRSPHQHLLGDVEEIEPDTEPFTAALPCSIALPESLSPKGDVLIDDLFSAFLQRHSVRGGCILPFVLHLLGRPLDTREMLHREDVLSLSKFKAEATPAECKIILGWLLNTRCLTIALPLHKVEAWSASILAILDRGRATYQDLDTLIGRLNHVGFIIPNARHFLGRLRATKHVAKNRGGHVASLRSPAILDLKLWLKFLQRAQHGISLNLITFRAPTHFLRSDSCEHGIGGYNLRSGRAWRWEIPIELRHRTSLNSLEFLACYVALAVALETEHVPQLSCLLSQTDSTSTAGWMHKSNFS